MRTLEETRAWMREGMPLAPEPRIPEDIASTSTGLCELFWMQVMGGHPCAASRARILVGCSDCDVHWGLGEIVLLQPDGRWESEYLCKAAIQVCNWVEKHALDSGMPGGDAFEAYNHGGAFDQVVNWTARMMSGGLEVSGALVGMTIPLDRNDRRGIYLNPDVRGIPE